MKDEDMTTASVFRLFSSTFGLPVAVCVALAGLSGCGGRSTPDVELPSGPQVEAEIQPDGSMEAGADPAADVQ